MMMDGIVMDGCLAIRFDVFQKSMLHAGSNQTYVGSCLVVICGNWAFVVFCAMVLQMTNINVMVKNENAAGTD
jgi:hypothetical protein